MSDVWAVPGGRYHRAAACAYVNDGDVIPPRMSVEQAEAFGLKSCGRCIKQRSEVEA